MALPPRSSSSAFLDEFGAALGAPSLLLVTPHWERAELWETVDVETGCPSTDAPILAQMPSRNWQAHYSTILSLQPI